MSKFGSQWNTILSPCLASCFIFAIAKTLSLYPKGLLNPIV